MLKALVTISLISSLRSLGGVYVKNIKGNASENELSSGSVWERVGWVYWYTRGVRGGDKGYCPSSNTSVG